MILPMPLLDFEAVQQAVLLLQSIGVQHLCHESEEDAWDPILPLCNSSSSVHEYNEDIINQGLDDSPLHYLRGTITTAHRQLVLAAAVANEEEGATTYYTFNIVGAACCVCGVALVSGLFLGLLTLDILQLRIIERASIDEDEKLYARTLLPIVEERHLLLVTLLLMNTLAYETLPLFLDALVPSWVAILLSTTLVMWFGEILPSGIFTGPHQLYLGYKMAPLTRCFLWIMYPFAKPLALCLDYLVKEKDDDTTAEVYHRGELSALVRIQYEDSRLGDVSTAAEKAKIQRTQKFRKHKRDDSWHATKQEIIERANEYLENHEEPRKEEEQQDPAEQLAPPLDPTEVDLIEGALQMKTVLVMDVYTPLSQVYSIADDLVLDKSGFTEIYRQGYSRVPVYRSSETDPDEKTLIVGFLMVRQLILIDWDHCREVSTLPLQRPKCVSPRMNLVDALRILRTHGYLMAFVCARPDLGNKAFESEKPLPVDAGFMGIVTLADIMESLLQERIYDEWDIRDRDRAVATLQRWAATKLQDFVRKKTKAKRQLFQIRESSQEHSCHSEATENERMPLIHSNNASQHAPVNGGYKSVSQVSY